MPAVTFTAATGVIPARVQAELTVLTSPHTVIVLPITNPEAAFKGMAPAWQQVERPGRKPILARAGETLTTLDLKVTVAAPDGGRLDPTGSVEYTLGRLAALAILDSEAAPIALTWGAFDTSQNVTSSGLWHLQSIEIDSELRQPGTNNITRAEATITLIEASDAPAATGGGSVPAWAQPPAPPQPVAAASVRSPSAWTVSASDTAYSIATAVYGSAEPGWRTILTANGITNPTALTPGMTLLIPSNAG